MNSGKNQKILAIEKAIDVNTLMSVTDVKGNILKVNEMFCSVSKYSAEELIGQNHRIINSGYHSKEFFSKMWKTLISGKQWQGEIKNRAKDGSYYWVDTVIVPVFDSKGQIENFLSLRFLITDKKIAEERVNKYIKQLEDLAIDTSHILRSPLTQLMGVSNIIEKDNISQGEMEKIAQYMKDSINKLNEYTINMNAKLNNLKKEFRSSTALKF